MKLLVFAHVPPPHHGQSYMVKLMLDGFAAQQDIECLHVDARYSADLTDTGAFRLGKVTRMFTYCLRALQLRARTGVTTLYYVPAPPRRIPLLRDLATLAVLRPCFSKTVFHWHATGLGEWLESQPRWLRWPARALLGHADLSVVLAAANETDARRFAPLRCAVVHNGIPDPNPDFDARLRARRAARTSTICAALATNRGTGERIRVFFLGMCTREKGLFDGANGVRIANARLAQRGNPCRFELHVAGDFPSRDERLEFDALLGTLDWKGLWHYHGYVGGAQKQALFESCDILLFPTFYSAEGFPVVVLEAMAAGMPIVTTRWRAIPEVLPEDYDGFVSPRNPDEIANALDRVVRSEVGLRLRERYLRCFTLERHLRSMAEALAHAE